MMNCQHFLTYTLFAFASTFCGLLLSLSVCSTLRDFSTMWQQRHEVRSITGTKSFVATRVLWGSIMACAFVALPTSTVQAFPDKYDHDIKRAVRTYWPGGPDWLWLKAQLWQESRLDPLAVSPAGAQGIAQFMPGTWKQMRRELGVASPFNPKEAIDASAFFMFKMSHMWRRGRTVEQRHPLAMASYNAGPGNIIKAQALCNNARHWPEIWPCLPIVTGHHSKETIDYVRLIGEWHRKMKGQ